MTNTGKKQYGEKGLSGLQLQSLTERSQGQELRGRMRQELNQRPWEKHCLQAFILWIVHIVLLYNPLRLGIGTDHSGLVSDISIISQGNAPQIYLQANLMKAILQLKVPIPR